MIKGYQFDKEKVTSDADASLYSYLNNNRSLVMNGRGNSMKVSAQGLNVTVDTGEAIIQGRLVKITEAETLAIPPNYDGYIVIEIDLSQENTATGTPGSADYATINNQITLKYVDSLVQDDLNNGGVLYHFNLGKISSATTEVEIKGDENVGVKDIVYSANPIKAVGTTPQRYSHYEIQDPTLPRNELELFDGLRLTVKFESYPETTFLRDLTTGTSTSNVWAMERITLKINDISILPVVKCPTGRGGIHLFMTARDVIEGMTARIVFNGATGEFILENPSRTVYGDKSLTALSFPANNATDYKVDFFAPCPVTPSVIVSLSSISTAGAMGGLTASAINISPVGFTLRCFNSGSTARSPIVAWQVTY